LKSHTKRAYYPIFLDVTEKPCLVLGGGNVAKRKVAMLLRFNARVTVVSPIVNDAILKLAQDGRIEIHQRPYALQDLDRCALVFACTDDNAVNGKVREEAAVRNIPVNVADCPQMCDFIVPSIIKRKDLTIAVSTSGELPLLSRKLREKIEEIITDDYLEYLAIIGKFRKRLMTSVSDTRKRSMIMAKIDEMDIRDVVTAGLSKIENMFGL